MKFAPIIFHRSFLSHCSTVIPNLTLAIENYLRSSDQSLTWQTTTDYLRLFPRLKFSHRPIFYPILRSVGQWDAGLRLLVDIICVRGLCHRTLTLLCTLLDSSILIWCCLAVMDCSTVHKSCWQNMNRTICSCFLKLCM